MTTAIRDIEVTPGLLGPKLFPPWPPPLALCPQSVAAPPLDPMALNILGTSLGLPGLTLGLR